LIEEDTDEHAVEDGLLSEAMEDGKVTKALATARWREVKRGGADLDEIGALRRLINLYSDETAAKKAAKDAKADLDLATLKQYGHLTVADVKQLVLDDKWQAALMSRISSELQALTLALVGRIKELGERYDATLADLESSVDRLSTSVGEHLADMGLK
jgi:type I restriction enzyme M protein